MASLLHNALIKCYLIIHFWKLEFNFYLMVYCFVEKGIGVNVQRMLKMSCDSTLAEILSKTFVKKNRRKIGDLIYDHGLT